MALLVPQLLQACFYIGESRLVTLFFISFMCGFHVSFVQFEAKVCWCFFLGNWLIIDGKMELLFDVGEREGGFYCLFSMDGDTPVWYRLGDVAKRLLILSVAVAVASKAFHIAKSSAWRALETFWERLVVISLMKTKREWENSSSLWDTFPHLEGMAQTVVECDSHSSVAQEAFDPSKHSSSNLCCRYSFRRTPFSHLIECLGQGNNGGNDFLRLKCVFYRLSKVYELVFSAPVLPEGGLFFSDQVIGFQVPDRPLVDHALECLVETASWWVCRWSFS